ncbi:MAG: glycine zipper 2TM domain-containing protein [Gemmatimonadaceae bacterium]
MPTISRQTLRPIAFFAVVALASACQEKAPAATDSSLAQDLAMAQRNAVTPTVFNDAPLGGSVQAERVPNAPTPKPQPPRANTPTPRPVPKPRQPPAQVARAPEPTPPQPVATAPAEVPAAAPAPAAGVIGTGSRVGMSTNGKVCTASLLVGDKFTATVTSGTTGSNGASIPAGAIVVLEVASIDRADPIESSRIEFRVRSVEVNGDAQSATGDVASLGTMTAVNTSSGNDRNKVIGGAVAGAVLGRIFGKSTKATVIGAAAGAAAGTVAAQRGHSSDACLPEGSPMRLTLTRDIVVRRSAI